MNNQPTQGPIQYLNPPASPVAVPAQPIQNTPGQPTNNDNPGQTLGIFSLIIAVVFGFFAPIGLVLGIISIRKSKNAGQSAALGIIGTVLNSLWLLFAAVLVIFFVFLANKTTFRTEFSKEFTTAITQSYSNQVSQEIEIYASSHGGQYPASSSDVVTLLGHDSRYEIVDSNQPKDSQIGYKMCSTGGAQLYYLDSLKNKTVIHALGSASLTVPC